MNFFTNLFDINPSTLSGSVDIISVLQPNGTLKASPFHVRFGKNMLLMKTNRKLVDIYINGSKTELVMKLGSAGEAYFVELTDEIGEDDIPASSPIQSESGDAEPEEDIERTSREKH